MEGNKPNNPDAFPLEGYSNGMTLRDYFAAKAMNGLLCNSIDWLRDKEHMADLAYQTADAMLKQREL